MIRRLILLLALGLSLSAHGSAESEREARSFFARYVTLSEAYDPAVADLYADHAVIRAFRRYPHGLERAMEMSGAQWKVMIRRVMPLAKAQNDRSEYKEPRFEVAGDKTKISAKRYSVRKCYWDPNYYMVLQKRPYGAINIVEEYSESQPQSDC